jgi:hypothetical protein
MKKPVLVIMAAGMGSRYGGLKQIDPIDQYGNIIIDYSIFDAKKAGFEKVVFVIKKENEKDFMSVIGNRIGKYMDVSFAFQSLQDLPEGFQVPEGRVKPWGTSQAIMSIRDIVDGPFAVINADDYYGSHAFQTIYDYLMEHGEEKDQCAMVGYILKNTLTENGHVARGVCEADEQGHLVAIHERTKIIKTAAGAAYSEDDGETWVEIDPESTVSMNLWGFSSHMIGCLKEGFAPFLQENLPKNPMKCEYLLPTSVSDMMAKGELTVNVLHSTDKWYGVTYKEDKPDVVKAIQSLKDSGLYPQTLWEA